MSVLTISLAGAPSGRAEGIFDRLVEIAREIAGADVSVDAVAEFAPQAAVDVMDRAIARLSERGSATVRDPSDDRDVALAALLNWRMEDRITGTATDEATLVLRDVADRLGAPEGRPFLTLRQALAVYADDAIPCDDPGCRDGTAPVCDPQSVGCQLRRLALRPGDVHELIAAEHRASGYDPDTA